MSYGSEMLHRVQNVKKWEEGILINKYTKSKCHTGTKGHYGIKCYNLGEKWTENSKGQNVTERQNSTWMGWPY
jgi:hypothetical protein